MSLGCPLCGLVGASVVDLETHLRMELAYASLHCLLCPARFFTQADLKAHYLGPFARHPAAALAFAEVREAAKEARLAQLLRLPPPPSDACCGGRCQCCRRHGCAGEGEREAEEEAQPIELKEEDIKLPDDSVEVQEEQQEVHPGEPAEKSGSDDTARMEKSEPQSEEEGSEEASFASEESEGEVDEEEGGEEEEPEPMVHSTAPLQTESRQAESKTLADSNRARLKGKYAALFRVLRASKTGEELSDAMISDQEPSSEPPTPPAKPNPLLTIPESVKRKAPVHRRESLIPQPVAPLAANRKRLQFNPARSGWADLLRRGEPEEPPKLPIELPTSQPRKRKKSSSRGKKGKSDLMGKVVDPDGSVVVPPGKFPCAKCDAAIEKTHFKGHVFSRHMSEMPFWCKVCDYRCKHRGNLKGHLKRAHGLEYKEENYGETKVDGAEVAMLAVECFGPTQELGYARQECKQCAAAVRTGERRNHAAVGHLKKAVQLCRLCDYTNNSVYRQHIAKHLWDAHKRMLGPETARSAADELAEELNALVRELFP